MSYSYVRNVKKWEVTDFVVEKTCPEENPNSEKIIGLCQRVRAVSVSPKILQLDV